MNKKHILPMLLIGGIVSGCAPISNDFNTMSGRSSLSQPPSKSEIASAASMGSPIAISAIHAERNYANGIDVSITFENIDEARTVKYVTFKVEYINRVGDVVNDEISSKSISKLESTGPYEPSKISWGAFGGWNNTFYHANADRIQVVFIDVEFMNGDKLDNINVRGIEGGLGFVTDKKY